MITFTGDEKTGYDYMSLGEFLTWVKENNIPLDAELAIREDYLGTGGGVEEINYDDTNNVITFEDRY